MSTARTVLAEFVAWALKDERWVEEYGYGRHACLFCREDQLKGTDNHKPTCFFNRAREVLASPDPFKVALEDIADHGHDCDSDPVTHTAVTTLACGQWSELRAVRALREAGLL